MRFIQTIIIAATLLVANLAFAQDTQLSDDEVAKRVETVLTNYEVVPDRKSVEEFIPNAQKEFIEAAKDEAGIIWTRQRATTLLSLFPNAESIQALTELTEDANPEIRRMAYYTLGRGMASVDAERVVALLEEGLSDSDEEVREWSVRGLRYVANDRAQRLLENIAAGSNEELSSIATAALKKRAIN